MPKDFDDKIIAFHKFVIGLRKNNSYLLSQTGNVDQTPLYFLFADKHNSQRERGKELIYLQKWIQKSSVAL
jgi:hypothetical protein